MKLKTRIEIFLSDFKVYRRVHAAVHALRGKPLIANMRFDRTIHVAAGNDNLLISDCTFRPSTRSKKNTPAIYAHTKTR